MKPSSLYTGLAFAGATPFLACGLLPLIGVDAIAPLGRLDTLASSYGLAIICFLAGAHWATYLLRHADIRINLLISSNVVLLVVWFAFVAAGIAWALVAQLAAFIVLLLIDYRLLGDGVISAGYFRVRGIATTLAVFSIFLILIT
ncbi:MAG: DUF3429 domain-containing protein [Gammaproteobacteria bacterium]|nr:DUF3429 domain-containing protein [Gammaproteobacteria bacterium]MBU2677402.1 DUF3429 domain-containing protein [Gammaproteobacteria bacterium]NNC57642.1 DUF3429 domain-containing protein [Woeseiaceae bacterium]NNL51134.1 DUF3429 domain-containing protein [Woeseiaceae bacterium]